MIILLSPAKNLDFSTPLPDDTGLFYEKGTEPLFSEMAHALVRNDLSGLGHRDFEKLMGINSSLARKVSDWYAAFGNRNNPSRPALFAYDGAVYRNMAPRSWDRSSLAFGRKHIRILSALYGCLRPGDFIEPYRLDMKTPLKPGNLPSLKVYWKESVTEYLNSELEKIPGAFILDAASSEFSSVLDRRKLNFPFITLQFKEKREGKLKTVGTYAKMARGIMVRKVVETEATDTDAMKEWDIMGYRYNPEGSSKDELLFCR